MSGQRRKHALGFIPAAPRAETHGNIKGTLIETFFDLVVGAGAGCYIGSAIGKWSAAWGVGVAGTGHFTQNKFLQLLGIGMMAANGWQSKLGNGVGGVELEGLEGVKERLQNFTESFSEKFFLDKFLKKPATPQATNGLGNGSVQYFTYPESTNGVRAADDMSGLGAGEVDWTALDHINKQIEESGKKYGGIRGVGTTDDMSGVGAMDEMSGWGDETNGVGSTDDMSGIGALEDLSGGLDPTSSIY